MPDQISKNLEDIESLISNLSREELLRLQLRLQENIAAKEVENLSNPTSIPVPELSLQLIKEAFFLKLFEDVASKIPTEGEELGKTSVVADKTMSQQQKLTLREWLRELLSRKERELGSPERSFRTLDMPRKWMHISFELLEILEAVTKQDIQIFKETDRYTRAVRYLYLLVRFVSIFKRFPHRKKHNELSKCLQGIFNIKSFDRFLSHLTVTLQGTAEREQEERHRQRGCVGCDEHDPEAGTAYRRYVDR